MGLATAASAPPALLTYAITPPSVNYSGTDAQSIVTLTISATNGTGSAISCSSLMFTVPFGVGEDALSADPTSVTCAPGPTTPWAIAGNGDGTWSAVPLPPVAEIAAAATVSFVLGNVVVNQLPSQKVTITVQEVSSGQARSGAATLAKAGEAAAGAAPAISSFVATPTAIALNGTVTLTWDVSDAPSCLIDPGPIAVTGSNLTLQVTQDTVYTLTALGPGGSATATASVAVEPVDIKSFASEPADIAPGDQTTLSWTTAYASSCSIDQGIGPVATSGTHVVTPQQTTTYSLTASGLDGPLTKTTLVTVQDG